MAGAFPYIGCKISLLSKHGIRYEGTLYTIDPNDSTIALSNVRCFGTEGRRAKDNLPEVEPAPEVFEFIIFKGNDIADLTVCDQPGGAQPAPAAAAPAQPPPQQQRAPGPPRPAAGLPQPMAAAPQPRAPGAVGGGGGQRGGPRRDADQRLGTGELLTQRRTQKAGTALDGYKATDYDFEDMNQKFDKTTIAGDFAQEVQQKVEVGYKPQSSFFDSISCETLDRQKARESKEERPGYAKRREQDMETFGETFGRNSNRGYRGNRSGGGKGGGGKGGGDRGGKGDGRRRNRGGKGNRGDGGQRQGQKSEGEWRTVGK